MSPVKVKKEVSLRSAPYLIDSWPPPTTIASVLGVLLNKLNIDGKGCI
jgi:hypothetical protein